MLCFGFFAWLSPPSCACTAWFGMRSTTVTEKRPTQSVKMAPTVRTSPGLTGKVQKVLKTAPPGIQATARAILPEEGIDIPSQKSPTEWERNEKTLVHNNTRCVQGVPRTGRGRNRLDLPGGREVERHSVIGKERGWRGGRYLRAWVLFPTAQPRRADDCRRGSGLWGSLVTSALGHQ